MKRQLFKRAVAMLIVCAMILGYVPGVSAAGGVTWEKTDREITAELTDRLVKNDETASAYEDSQMIRVSIVLENPSTVEAGYATMGIAAN